MASSDVSRLRPELLHLVRECHANWLNLHSSLLQTNQHRRNVLASFAERVRTCCDSAVSALSTAPVATQDEADDIAADIEDLKTAYAIFMAAELSFIDMADGDHSVLCALRWLKHNFLQAVTESQLTHVLQALRSPSAISDPDIAPNVWDLTAKLVIEGEPHDGGKLLLLYAQLIQSREMATFAHLLCAYPTIGALTSKEGALAYQTAWREWKEQASTFLRSGEQQRYPPFVRGHAQYLPVFHSLAQIVAGEAWGSTATGAPVGLQTLPIQGSVLKAALPQGASPASPYARWFALAMCTLMFGPVCPSAQGRASVVQVMKHCISSQGLTCDPQVLQHGVTALKDSTLSGEHLRAAFMRIFEGDAVLACEVLSLYGQEWASIALTELLWASGPLQKTGNPNASLGWQPATPFALLRSDDGKEVPYRAHKLLAYAKYLQELDPTLGGLASLYAYAATPAAAMAATGLSERDVRLRLSQCGPEGRLALSSGLPLPVAVARGNGSSFTPELRAAKLAILTGSTPLAHTSVGTVLQQLAELCVARDDEDGVETCLALAQRCAAEQETSVQICTLWAKHCLVEKQRQEDLHSVSYPRLGSALLWYLRADSLCTVDGSSPSHAGCEAWAHTCLSLLQKAIDSALAKTVQNNVVSSRAQAETACSFLRSSPDVLSIDGALVALGHRPLPAPGHEVASSTAQDSLTESATLAKLLSKCPTLHHLLAVRRMTEYACLGWLGQGPAGHGRSDEYEVSSSAHEAFTQSAMVWTRLVGQRSVSSYPAPQESELRSWPATCRLLRLGTIFGLLQVRHRGQPAMSADQSLDVADRLREHEVAQTKMLARSADQALAVLRGVHGAKVSKPDPDGELQISCVLADGEERTESLTKEEQKSLTELLARSISDARATG